MRNLQAAGHDIVQNRRNGAPRPMKMGTTVSPWRYDAVARCSLPSAKLRRPTTSHYAWYELTSLTAAGRALPKSLLLLLQSPR
jgi:hypothetical protein